MSDKKNLIRNISSLGIVQIVNYIFPLITIPYISRVVGPTGIGIVNYIAAFVAYFTIVVGYGFDLSATRRIAQNYLSLNNRRTVFSYVSNARFFLFLLSTFFFVSCLYFFNYLRDHLLLSIITYINVVSVLISPQYIFQGLQNLTIFSFSNLIRGIINTALIFLLIRDSQDYILYATIGIFLNLFNNIFFLLYAYIKFNLKLYRVPLKTSIRILYEERFIFFSSVIFSLYTSTNVVILGFFDKPDKIAFYTVAVGFIGIVQSVINIPLSTSLYPFLGSSFSKNFQTGIMQLKKIIPVVVYLTFFCAICLIVFASLIIKIIYGPKFLNAVICVRILAFLPLISSVASLLGVQVMLNLKMDKDFIKITFQGAIISIILNLVFGFYFSYIGTAVSYLVTEIYIIFALFRKLGQKNIKILEWHLFKPSYVMSNIRSLM